MNKNNKMYYLTLFNIATLYLVCGLNTVTAYLSNCNGNRVIHLIPKRNGLKYDTVSYTQINNCREFIPEISYIAYGESHESNISTSRNKF